MLLNGDIVDIGKPDRIRLLTFAIDYFPGLFLHPSIVSTLKVCLNNNGALSDFWYWLNSNILVSSEGIMTLQKSLF